MATVDLSNQTVAFSWSSATMADFASHLNHNTTFYQWTTTQGHVITATGAGIAVNGSNIPTGGTITSITIDLNNDSPGTPDIVITGLSVDLTALANNDGIDENNDFWAAVLDGPTTVNINPNTTTGFSYFGGGFAVLAAGQFLLGDDDVFNGGSGSKQNYFGDFLTADGASVVGGHDTFNGAFAAAAGDGTSLENGALLQGGNDIFVQTIDYVGGPTGYVYGDVYSISDSSMIGGGDTITALDTASNNLEAYGDFYFVAGASLVQGGADTVTGTGNNDTIYGEGYSANDVYTIVNGGGDILNGEDGADTIYGDLLYDYGVLTGGADTIAGGAGDDFLYGDVFGVISTGNLAGGNDTIDGGTGNDTIYGDWLTNNGTATGGADTIHGGAGFDTIYGNGGNDTLYGDANADTLYGDDGLDMLYGGDGVDTLHGGADNDTLYGDQGNDILYGDDGEDILNGGTQDDKLYGGADNDTLSGNAGFDTLHGDGGNDTLNGGDQADTLYGDDGDDTLNGDAGADTLYGGNQNDTLNGGAGNDTLNGQGGFDILVGGTGNDTLTGGAQADTFVFEDGFGADTITDFAATNNAEKIDLSGVTSIVDWLDLSTPANGHMYQSGADVLIDDLAGNTIALTGINIGDLDAADFIF